MSQSAKISVKDKISFFFFTLLISKKNWKFINGTNKFSNIEDRVSMLNEYGKIVGLFIENLKLQIEIVCLLRLLL